ncbi:DUF6257 family protein [Streptomyces sp. NY05-11A]|uniref:DUF6257 family protein n=1 Tax=Streptomyces soliscabiei TaxID=588897 RepID=UPI0029BD00B3|nr:DUF6257 family protein [Streptomyces sp. NY05-11A]MDX2675811.1 DUF6257 family protein [Streptomyces sp. NY05-11A]
MREPKLTLGERLAIVRLEARGIRRAAAGITHQPDIDRGIERIKDRARQREANGKQQ